MNQPPRGEGPADRPETLASLVRLVADRAANPTGHRTRICVFLGAGADLSSGGVSFGDLKRQAVEEFTRRPLFDITTAEDIDARFESLFLQLEPDDRALLVEAIFRRLQPLHPSDAYKLLVLLAEAGGIDAVVTTNFDVMLERAQEELGRDLFQIYAPGVARPYLLSAERFELPRRPYLKLHGDIASRSVLLLTRDELSQSDYDKSMLDLFRSIVRTHDLVFAGYGGNDPALAQIIGDAVESGTNRIFWCGPHAPLSASPLYQRLQHRVRYVRVGFDALMMEVARPILERPSLIATEPSYLRCLFDWRLDYSNREYVQTYAQRSGRSMVDVYARRQALEDRVRAFLLSNRPLAVVAGPSGFGKTTLGIRLHKVWNEHRSTRLLLIRSRALPASGDIEQHIAEQLGGLGSKTAFSLFRLERWLAESSIRLVLYIDGINEFSADLARCVHLFRTILRFCYFLPEADSALRVIATIRQETWNLMLSHLDVAQLRKTMWTGGDGDQGLSAIPCEEFTDDELADALQRLRHHGYASIDAEALPPSTLVQMHDPYLLGTVAETVRQDLPSASGACLYQRAFEAKLKNRGSFVDNTTIKEVLSSIALKCLSTDQDKFREVDITPAAVRGEIIRLMKDLHVFVDAGDGFLQFDHDRTLEYFLAVGLGSGAGPSLETLDDVLRFVRTFRTQGKAIAAARLYFQLAPRDRFALISRCLRLRDQSDASYPPEDRERLFGFGREVLTEMTEAGEPLAQQYLDDVVRAAAVGQIGEHQLRAAVQAMVGLPVQLAIPLLTSATHAASDLPATEANIYAIDKLVARYLQDDCETLDFLQAPPYAVFFGDRTLTGWEKLGRLLSFAAEVGPDNTHPEEYANAKQSLNMALNQLLREPAWEATATPSIAKLIRRHCDRLMFNATEEAIETFFRDRDRSRLMALVTKLGNGFVLTDDDMQVIQPYTQSFDTEVQYHLCHLMLVLSSLNDLTATLRIIERKLAAFSNTSSPIEIDFVQAAVVYLHVLHNLRYDEQRFGIYEQKILRDWPDILLFRPGVMRGERRGFHDLFDRVFEDGFGVIYPYGVLRPSLRRRKLRQAAYRRELSTERASPLPLYTKYLDEFLRSGRIEEALQVVQTLAGVIVLWPMEGLLTLRSVVGYPDPQIRRAVVRVLAEAFNRHPSETLWFLKTSGAAVSDEELIEVKIRHEAHIGRRQINEEEWARIGHFLLTLPGARQAIMDCVAILLRADSLEHAIGAILQRLGLGAGR
jgi:hypothetical protein